MNIDSLQKIYDQTRADSLKMNILSKFVDHYIGKDQQKAYDYATAAIDLAKASGSAQLLSKAYQLKGQIYMQNKDYEHALASFHQALNYSLKTNKKNTQAFIYGNLGRIHRFLSYYDSAIYYYQLSLSIREKLGDSMGVYRICNNLGLIYRNQSILDKALYYFTRSMNGFEREGDKNLMASPMMNIGNIFYSKEDYDKALEYYQNALKLKENSGDDSGIADLNINIGSIYLRKGMTTEALEIFNQTIPIYQKVGNTGRIAHCYDNIGDVYLKLEDYEKAGTYIRKGLELRRTEGNQMDIAFSLNNLADYLVLTKQPDKAFEIVHEAIEIGKKANAPLILERSYRILIDAYRQKHQYQKAIDILDNYLSAHDSVIKLASNEQLIKQSLQYEFDRKQEQLKMEQKEKEMALDHRLKMQRMFIFTGIGVIILLIVILFLITRVLRLRKRTLQITRDYVAMMEQQNEELKQQQKEIMHQHRDLEKLIATRDKFFSIIAHDLKNPFNTIQGLAELLIKDFDKNTPEQQKQMLEMLFNSSKNAYKLVENLLDWASTQTGIIKITPEKFDIANMVKKTIELFGEQAGMKRIRSEYFGLPEAYVYADLKMAETVIRNLISNAIKYSYEDSIIRVSAIPDNNMICITVEDSGTGMTQDQINNLFKIERMYSTEGTAHEMGTGLGLIISNEFVIRNNGEMHIESTPGKGTKFSFTVPAYKTAIEENQL